MILIPDGKHLDFFSVFHQYDNLTISKSKIKVANSFQNMIKWSVRDAVSGQFPRKFRIFLQILGKNIAIQFFCHFICQAEIRFGRRSVKQNLSFPYQFPSFNFLTHSSGICTPKYFQMSKNCDLNFILYIFLY